MTYGRGPGICTSYNISSDAVEKIESIKDLGVKKTFDNKLKFDEHINNKIKKAYQTLGIVKIFFYLFNT